MCIEAPSAENVDARAAFAPLIGHFVHKKATLPRLCSPEKANPGLKKPVAEA
jgi:hypothetical protein